MSVNVDVHQLMVHVCTWKPEGFRQNLGVALLHNAGESDWQFIVCEYAMNICMQVNIEMCAGTRYKCREIPGFGVSLT